MNSIKGLFDPDAISYINEFIESKSNLLNQIDDFKEKDRELSFNMEELEKSLKGEEKDRFYEIIKLMYQVEDYYVALAYLLGNKYGRDMESI